MVKNSASCGAASRLPAEPLPKRGISSSFLDEAPDLKKPRKLYPIGHHMLKRLKNLEEKSVFLTQNRDPQAAPLFEFGVIEDECRLL
jgi:hypothetical protein